VKVPLHEFTKGIWKENPIFVLVLGMCPTLAVSGTLKNCIGMGIATTFVLVGSNLCVSAIRRIVPREVRIPCYIIVIAVFVTVVEMLMKAYAPPTLNAALGIFIPLIVVNCIVMGRAEAFASRNGLGASLLDALGMGLGFTLALSALGVVREFGSSGTLLDVRLIPAWKHEFLLLKFSPGAFILLGLFLAGMNALSRRRARRQGRHFEPPAEMNCARCRVCDLGGDR
jgi:electron transport complex protein RnfE